MARTDSLSNFLTDVASAIKTKKGSETSIPAANFDTEILAIPVRGQYQTKIVNISQNGSTIVTPDAGYDAIEGIEIIVAIPETPLQTKTVQITSNGNITILPDTGYEGMTQVGLEVAVPGQVINNQNKTFNQNGTYTADQGYTGLGTVVVDVAGTDPEYDTNLALSYQILGIEPYMIEVEKITSQIDDIDYPAGDLGSISLTPMKLEIHPQLNIPVTTEDATDIANLFNNGTSLTIELHNAHGSGSQLLIADGGITFDCGHMAHISYEWKEHPWSGTPGQMLATPVWSAEQAWDILDVASKSPLTQEDLDKVVTAFNDGWYPINEGYLRLQWSYRSGYTLTSMDKQNINSLLTYLFKYLGITLTDIPLT